MVSRGAKFLILLSSSAKQSYEIDTFLTDIRAAGVTLAVPVCDISDSALLSIVIGECRQTMPPIKGCVQAAMVLKVSVALWPTEPICELRG